MDIIDGPSKWDLSIALFEGKELCFFFKGDGWQKRHSFVVQGIEREDGSNESWTITGKPLIGALTFEQFVPTMKLWFHTKRREGRVIEGGEQFAEILGHSPATTPARPSSTGRLGATRP